MRPLDQVLVRLEGVEARNGGSSFMALCPAHPDTVPSLSVTEANDGRVLLRCHAGCATQAILQAVGLAWRDLYPSSINRDPQNAPQRQRVWQIRSSLGELVAVHHRLDNEDGKRLWWTRPGGRGLAGMHRPHGARVA